MKKLASTLTATIAGLALAATPTATLADHIDGHDNCDPVFPVPLPGEEFFHGGVLFVTAIGPVEDDIITNTTFDITWVSDGATPASDLLLHGSVQVDNTLAYFTVTGEDLGFGSGPGKFKGTFSTDTLNGVVWPGVFPPYSIVDLQIDSVNGGGIQGYAYFVDSFINFDVIPAPPCAPPCPTDLDGDGTVGASDLLSLLVSWGLCKRDCPADFDGDGSVGASDLLVLLVNWGPCP